MSLLITVYLGASSFVITYVVYPMCGGDPLLPSLPSNFQNNINNLNLNGNNMISDLLGGQDACNSILKQGM